MMEFLPLPQRKPHAIARLQGSEHHPKLTGVVRFYQREDGVLVLAQLSGLPVSGKGCERGVFGFHIHAGSSCSGNDSDPFADALAHFDTRDCPHPQHAGDLPPLFATLDGRAFLAVLSDRFFLREVIGRTLIVHASPDDLHTQPSGNAGEKIACGRIVKA